MQTTSPKEPTKNKKKSRFRDFITGEFMVDKDVKSTYPFIGFVVLLFVLSILTQGQSSSVTGTDSSSW